MRHVVTEYFLPTLRSIDRRLPDTDPAAVPRLQRPVPLSVWGVLTLAVPKELPNLRRLIPAMPADDLQVRWVGASGIALLQQSVAFVEAVVRAHARWGNRRSLSAARILDHGCGWGRHLRLFQRLVAEPGMHGVDVSPEILGVARRTGVRARLAQIPPLPRELPFAPPFDLIYAFSVLTHLSEEAHLAALAVWRQWLAPDGLLVVTVRPRAYWNLLPDDALVPAMQAAHDGHGFAFGQDQGNGYGDASISITYMRRKWSEWRIVGIDASLPDPYQVLVFLRPA